MRYLGRLSGSGMLSHDGEPLARVAYDFDGYLSAPSRITSSGEIRAASTALRDAFARRAVELVTDDGRRFRLTFSAKALSSDSDVAHVDVTGDLPAAPKNWRH